MNQLDHAIETVLEELVERNKFNLRLSEETLAEFRRRHKKHIHHTLSSIKLYFRIDHSSTRSTYMATNPGGVTLTTAGQQATARVLFFDTDGQPMPSDFQAPAVAFSVDDSQGAVAKVVDNGDGTATVTAVGDGTANLSAKVTSAEGLELSDSVAVVVSGVTPPPPPPPPPTPVLGSIKIGFDQ